MQESILLVDDEAAIADLVEVYLKNDGFAVHKFYNGADALACAADTHIDLAILDVMLPDMDGFTLLQRIREKHLYPILMLTALDGEETQLRGFKLDIDDYVTKPFSMPVLLEKIRVILRRSDGMDGKKKAENCLRCRDLTLCPDTREAFAGGRLLDLTAREFDLLRTFLEAPGRVFTREMLLARLWGYDFYGDGRVVDTHIKYLRRKLGQDYIETVRGVGYRAAKETG